MRLTDRSAVPDGAGPLLQPGLRSTTVGQVCSASVSHVVHVCSSLCVAWGCVRGPVSCWGEGPAVRAWPGLPMCVDIYQREKLTIPLVTFMAVILIT